ncbi:hypothetical protein [Streptomyces gilvosporeus]|uniref:hypothetical protein n=1 Tax=Streptomyces gilvosporeus TaxID=553510 RepID=UPI00131BAAAA|nr:hypothetical protein [Streptomyces gilvosporeus]
MTAECRIAEDRLGGEPTLVASAPDGSVRAVLGVAQDHQTSLGLANLLLLR